VSYFPIRRYEVTLADVTVKAVDVGEALEVVADLLEAADLRTPTAGNPAVVVEGQDRRRAGEPGGSRVVITVDDELDEALTELAREGLRPVRLGAPAA
jgi:hypothetical protein